MATTFPFRRVSTHGLTAPRADRATRPIAIAAVVALHGLLLFALIHFGSAQSALRAPKPIMIAVITPDVAPPPPAEPPRRIVKTRPAPAEWHVVPPPIAATPAELPATIAVPAVESPPPPVTAVAAIAPSPVPSPLVPPQFNADYLENPTPPYPPLARRMREQGKVVLRVLVSADGRAEKVELRATSGSPRLDQSAQETVKHWKFVPARQGDEKVAAWVLVPISFTLET